MKVGPDPRFEVWRCQFLRALTRETEAGSINDMTAAARKHPLVIHEFFTLEMAAWMLEYEVLPWYDFVGATALFIASAYCRVEIVEWLLENGADPYAECKFPGMAVSNTRKTLNALDVLGQSLREPKPEAKMAAISALLTDSKRLPKPPPVPTAVIKSTWHTWYEMVPYALSKYHKDDVVLCKWKGTGIDKYTATVVQVNVKESKDAPQTYRLLFTPPDGGYYKAAVKKATRDGEVDTEVLYVFNDGKDPVPLFEDAALEEELTLADGSGSSGVV